MGSFSLWHWLIVLLIIVLVFGTKKLRNIGADLGGAVRDFKDGMRDEKSAEAAPQAAPAQISQASAAPQPVGQTIDNDASSKPKA